MKLLKTLADKHTPENGFSNKRCKYEQPSRQPFVCWADRLTQGFILAFYLPRADGLEAYNLGVNRHVLGQALRTYKRSGIAEEIISDRFGDIQISSYMAVQLLNCSIEMFAPRRRLACAHIGVSYHWPDAG